MASNKLSGNLIGVEIDGNFVACETSCELNFEVDLLGASAITSGRWKEYISGIRSWNVSVNASMLVQSAPTDASTIINAFMSGARMKLRIRTKIPIIGSIVISGYVLVQNGNIGAGVNTTSVWSTTLQGDGPFSYGDTEQYQAFYGYQLLDPVGDEANLKPQFSKFFEFGAKSITFDFSVQSQANFLYALVPTGQPVFNIWENNQFNFGDIPDFAWREPYTFNGFDYYVSRSILYITSSVPTITFRYKNLIPDQYLFNDIVDALINTVYESNEITISGITEPVNVSVVGGEMSINNGAYTINQGYVSAGDKVKVRITSSSNYTTQVGVTLTVGTISDTFDVTTAQDSTIYYAYNSASFVRQTCGSGQSPSGSVPYQKQYTSTGGQSAADALAQADLNNFNIEGQNNANLNGVCVADTIYIWGKIFEENLQNVNGVNYVDVFLRTYKSSSATVPPSNLSQPVNCTNQSIAVGFYDNVGDPPNIYNASMINTQQIRLAAPNTQSQNPVYPKQLTGYPGIDFWYAFVGKSEGDWQLLQVV